MDLRGYRHDVGVGWLWLAACAGAFGDAIKLAADRRMRTEDSAALSAGAPPRHGVGLGMLGSQGRPMHHYPDLRLTLRSGHQIAVELELTAKSSHRMARIMTAYASETSIDAVLYVVPSRAIAQLVNDAARRAGIADIVRVGRLAAGGVPDAGPSVAPAAVRPAPGRSRLRVGAER